MFIQGFNRIDIDLTTVLLKFSNSFKLNINKKEQKERNNYYLDTF